MDTISVVAPRAAFWNGMQKSAIEIDIDSAISIASSVYGSDLMTRICATKP
jgi:hypothetical protein